MSVEHGPVTRSPGGLGAALEPILEEIVRRVVVEELARAAPVLRAQDGAAEWLPKAVAARRFGVSVSLLARAVAAGDLSRGRRGRVNVDELKAFLGQPEAEAAPNPAVPELRRERAKRAARSILNKLDAQSGDR